MKKLKTIKLLLAMLFIFVTLLELVWAQSTLQKIKKQGFIRVGFANEVPYSYADSSGRLTGESPTVFKYAMEKLRVKEVDGVLTEWGSLIPGLKSGRFDAIVASMYITPTRCKEIIFSNPTYGIGDALVVATGKNNYTDLADAISGGARLAFVAGTAQIDHAKMLNMDESKLIIVPDFSAQTAAVKSGRADAAIMTDLTAKDVVGKVAGIERISYTFKHKGKIYKGQGGFGFRKEDASLKRAVDKILSKYIGSKEHLAAIEEFGFGKSNLPESTAADLCAGK